MPTPSEFEMRRRERRRRERRRKKRIRAAVILIALIGLIVIVCVAISTCAKRKSEENQQTDIPQTDLTEVTPTPAAPAVPTVAPAPVSGIPSVSENNDLLEIVEESGQTKHVYLTFDDGPTENITPQVLDVLRRYNVKATFFEVGSLIKANPDMARRVYEEGHLIANHSNGHNYEKLYASTETFINEINECYEAIKSVTGEAEPFKLIRFPGGSYNSSADRYSPVKQQCKETLKEYGFYYCDWNALNGDAEGRTKNAQELLDYMTDNMYEDENVVVLMHDAATKQATVESLPLIIEYFINNGYTFHRLDDVQYQSMTAAQTSEPQSGVSSDDEDTDYDSSDTDADSDTSSSSPSPSSTPSVTPSASPTPRNTMPPSGSQTGPIIIN